MYVFVHVWIWVILFDESVNVGHGSAPELLLASLTRRLEGVYFQQRKGYHSAGTGEHCPATH